MDGHVVTFTTIDPINAPVPNRHFLILQCLFIRVLRMAGRSGEDMLETFDSDDEVSLLAASNAGSTGQQTAHEPTQSSPYHDGTTHLEISPFAPSPDLGIDTPLEQPQKKRRKPSTINLKPLVCWRSLLACLHRNNGQNQTARLSSEENIISERDSPAREA